MKEIGAYIAPKCCICGGEHPYHQCLGCGAKYCGDCYLNLKMEGSEIYDMVHERWRYIVVRLCKKCGDTVTS